MLGWSLLVDRVHRNPTTGVDWSAPPRPWREALDTGLVKLAGLWTTWGLIGFVYAIGRWYWHPPGLFAMQVLATLLPIAATLSVPYILWIERRIVEPRDGCWQFGRLLLGHELDADGREALWGHTRAWAVKGFFTAFMLGAMPGNWNQVMVIDPARWWSDPVALGGGLVAVMFLVDVTIATIGYLATFRPLDSHIRSANPYAAAWTAALICYPPFSMMNAGGPLDYSPGLGHYDRWLAGHPLLLAIDAFTLIALTGIYAWATIAFGLRFSNLTHRGILTHGPYAWSKHPAYLAKNLFWWCFALPFLTTGDWTDGVRNCTILALVNAVYWWRAKTEERHLSADPVYVAYARWMAAHGPVTRLLARPAPQPTQVAAE